MEVDGGKIYTRGFTINSDYLAIQHPTTVLASESRLGSLSIRNEPPHSHTIYTNLLSKMRGTKCLESDTDR